MHDFTLSWPEIRTKASRGWCFRTHTMIGSHQLISDANTPPGPIIVRQLIQTLQRSVCGRRIALTAY